MCTCCSDHKDSKRKKLYAFLDEEPGQDQDKETDEHGHDQEKLMGKVATRTPPPARRPEKKSRQ
jgi:hypothetical protein